MSQLDTPLPPQGRGGKTANGVVGAAGKDARARTGVGERDQRGSAFSALLQTINGKTPHAGSAASETGKDAALDVAADLSDDSLAVEAMAPTPPMEPAAAASLDAVTRLLSGTMPAPVAPRETHDLRKEPGARRDAAMATLASALKDTGWSPARHVGPDPAAGVDAMPPDLPGIAMPSDDTPADTPPSADALAALSALVDEGAVEHGAADAEAAPAKPVSVTIIKQETYLPPVMRLSPFQQVVEPLRQAASELAATRSQPTPELDDGKPSEIAAPTKILHIELRPVELGSLVVKMRLTQGGMDIRIEAGNADTARMLANDKEALREVVKASGFSVDAVSVETIHIEGLAPDRQGPRQEMSPNDPSDQRQGRGFDQSRQGEQQQEPRRRGWTPDQTMKDEAHELETSGRGGGDTHRYL